MRGAGYRSSDHHPDRWQGGDAVESVVWERRGRVGGGGAGGGGREGIQGGGGRAL